MNQTKINSLNHFRINESSLITKAEILILSFKEMDQDQTKNQIQSDELQKTVKMLAETLSLATKNQWNSEKLLFYLEKAKAFTELIKYLLYQEWDYLPEEEVEKGLLAVTELAEELKIYILLLILKDKLPHLSK